MNLLASVTVLLQVVATFLTCIAAYISLILFVLAYLAVADLVHERSCLRRAYTVSSSSLDKCTASEDEKPVAAAFSADVIEAFTSFVRYRPSLLRRTH